ncbi:hypothetical protein M0813_14899 [Anaeramoeba flamelloides]|uniref:Uncharacterized protein n=1 Tax=Anaeramoeba flamelloides TaxID=1746091 RepID=A0AAV7ZTK0_9EUKA|nr:hypothetical protein M0812_10775 [Anaeramoeba flamelloides]KAJ6251544.1 hypothetical protein M0813_14899 [Anaeramoeba flamelloides]
MFDKATKIIYVFLALIALLSTILVILAPTLPHEITSDADDESSSPIQKAQITNQFQAKEQARPDPVKIETLKAKNMLRLTKNSRTAKN